MVRKTFLLCFVPFLTTGVYGVFTWTQPSGGNGSCGSVDENTDHGSLGSSTDINVTVGVHPPQIHYAVVTQPAGDVELSIYGQGSFSFDQGTIDYEAAQSMVVVFTVVDQAKPPETATGTCTIAVNDINDNAPVFPTNQVVKVDKLETGAVVSSTFTATDADGSAPNNQTVSYALEGPANAEPLFALDTVSGEITLECSSAYNLVVTAVDGGNPAMTGTGTLSVNMNPCSGAVGHTLYTLTSMLFTLAAALFIC